tara:strand:+ start:195 stop:362 length:168 start_codon:yes stop_codon:yes gene_type:complete
MNNQKNQIAEKIIEIFQTSDNLDNTYSLLVELNNLLNKKQIKAINKIIDNKSYLV